MFETDTKDDTGFRMFLLAVLFMAAVALALLGWQRVFWLHAEIEAYKAADCRPALNRIPR